MRSGYGSLSKGTSIWKSFLITLDKTNIADYFDFIELLNALPSHDWNQFFALIFETNLGDLMDAGLIGRILNEIQEAQHNEFLNAIARYIPSVFSGVHDIVFLLIVTPIYNWEKIVRYFEGRMDQILAQPNDMILLFASIHCRDWLSLHSVFRRAFRTCLIDELFFDDLYFSVGETQQQKDALLHMILQDTVWIARSYVLFANILKKITTNTLSTVFACFTEDHFRLMIPDAIKLFFFLLTLVSDELRSIVIYHMLYHCQCSRQIIISYRARLVVPGRKCYCSVWRAVAAPH